jgi:hypothetical protein
MACAAWLHDLLQPYVAEALVCDPRKNALLKAGNKNDRIDARKLADLLRTGLLSAVYHGENGIRTLKELARSYLALTRDATRVMNRLKAFYRSWAIRTQGAVPVHRTPWGESSTPRAAALGAPLGSAAGNRLPACRGCWHAASIPARPSRSLPWRSEASQSTAVKGVLVRD